MIKKTPSGFKVVSKKGKPLSKSNLSWRAAKNRLVQIEYHKNK